MPEIRKRFRKYLLIILITTNKAIPAFSNKWSRKSNKCNSQRPLTMHFGSSRRINKKAISAMTKQRTTKVNLNWKIRLIYTKQSRPRIILLGANFTGRMTAPGIVRESFQLLLLQLQILPRCCRRKFKLLVHQANENYERIYFNLNI